MKQPFDLQTPPPSLQAPDGIVVETPAVRVVSERIELAHSGAARHLGSLRVVCREER
jgi:hypothetical protein